MDNPIKTLREEAGYTQKQLADLLGVTEQTIRRTEQGTFTQIPGSVYDWAVLNRHINPKQLTGRYEGWRETSRELLSGYNDVHIYPYPTGRHPFAVFRERFMSNFDSPNTVSSFCKATHIDPRIVKRFESSYGTDIPHDVVSLLEDLRWPNINELREALVTWRQIGIGGRHE